MSIENCIRNKIRNEIKNKEELLIFYTQTNEKCRHCKDTEFSRSAIEKNNRYIQEITSDLENLRDKLENEKEIYNEKSKIIINSQIIISTTEKKEKLKYKTSVSDKEKKDNTYKKLRKERRTERWNKKKYGNYFNKYRDNVARLPPNIKENLENMPNNKGYIFRGIYFFGKNLPEEKEPVIMFEKVYNKFYIHKFYDKKTQLHCKKNGKVEFVSEKPYKKKFITPSDWPEITYAKKTRFKKSNYRNTNSRNYNRNKNTEDRNNRFNKKRILSSWNKK